MGQFTTHEYQYDKSLESVTQLASKVLVQFNSWNYLNEISYNYNCYPKTFFQALV